MEQIYVNYNSNFDTFLEFIKDTQEGKYTQDKPVAVDFTYQRLDIQEQGDSIDTEEYQENSYLFGITS